MGAILAPETLERLRTLPPRQALAEAKHAVYRSGAVSSEDFLDVYEQLVDEGVVSWEQVAEFGD